METPTSKTLLIGDWRVEPTSGQISRNGESVRLEVRTMLLLLCLAEHAGSVVSIEDLLNKAWTGVNVSPDSVYQAVASLRRVLGDDPKQPAYIATVPRLGYRMVAMVSPWAESTAADLPKEDRSIKQKPTGSRSRADVRRTMGVVFLVAGVLVFLLFMLRDNFASRDHPTVTAVTTQPQKSIAVLPFLDLTEGMQEEEFADGMTEELIDKLSKVPGLQVPAPTSSFYFKGKQIPVADIAKSLGVRYVLDGSVRKAGDRLRVAARLVRADNGYVIWTENYDRPFGDILMVQDDIAGEVTKALKKSIEGGPAPN